MSDMNLSLTQITQWLNAAQLHGDGRLTIQRVNTDSRTCQAGDLFVALKGERFDANDFLSQVAASGASAALAHHGLDQHARAQDVVLVAGKGHEDYQEISGVKYPFSDVQHAREALQQRRAHV